MRSVNSGLTELSRNKQKKKTKAILSTGAMAQLVTHLWYMHEDPSSDRQNPCQRANHRLGINSAQREGRLLACRKPWISPQQRFKWAWWCASVIPAQGGKGRRTRSSRSLQLYKEFEASWGYMRPCLTNKQNKQTKTGVW